MNDRMQAWLGVCMAPGLDHDDAQRMLTMRSSAERLAYLRQPMQVREWVGCVREVQAT
jgi:hypothetical protein